MGEKGEKPNRREFFRRKWEEPKVDFPDVPFPEGSKVTVKQVAYLHSFCHQTPADIVSRYPVSLADVYLALYWYHKDRKAIDQVIRQELAFNARDTLGDASMSLPSRRHSESYA